MNRISITVRLILLFAAFNVIAVGMFGLFWIWRNRPIVEDNGWITHTIRVKVQLEVVLNHLLDIETGERGFALTGDPTFLDPYENSLQGLEEALADLGQEISDNPTQRHFLADAGAEIREKVALSKAVITMRKKRGLAAATHLVARGQGKQSMDSIRTILASMQAEENRLLTLRRQARDAAVHRLAITIYLMSTLLILMSAGFSTILVSGTQLRDRLFDKLKLSANYDSLTALPNRRLLYELGDAACSLARRQGLRAALLYLDLDGFKAVNDTFGHERGDHLLQEVAQRLKACVRASDTIARIGGDEFVILLPELGDQEDAPAVAEKILATLGLPYLLGSITAAVTASIGIAYFPQHGDSMEPLLNAADAALYRAKTAGRNQFMTA